MNHSITLAQAVEMTKLYRSKKEDILKPEYAGKNILTFSESLDREIIDNILAQADCQGIRVYFGMNPDLQQRVIIVGVNSNNEDILPDEADADVDEDNIAEDGNVCPPLCPPKSPLYP